MTAKEYLSQPRDIRRKIRYLNLELERAEELISSIPHPVYGNVRVDKSPSNDTPNIIGLEKYYETKEKIGELNKRYKVVVEEITDAIDKLENDNYKLLLKYRYLNLIPISNICEKLFISYSTLKRWHNEAISCFKDIIWYNNDGVE